MPNGKNKKMTKTKTTKALKRGTAIGSTDGLKKRMVGGMKTTPAVRAQSPVWSKKASKLVKRRETRKLKGKSVNRVQKRINKELGKLKGNKSKKNK